jgi:hypothetical protein
MSVRGPVVEFEVPEVTKETDKALLCVIEGKEVWIPKSQIHDDSEVFEEGHKGKLVISEWIAKEKELI